MGRINGFVAVALLALVFAGVAYACVYFPYLLVGERNFTVSSGEVKYYSNLPGDYPTENLSTQQFDSYMSFEYRADWTDLSLSAQEKSTAWQFLKNGYSVEKMNATEYEEFIVHAAEINSDNSTCDYYPAVAYKDGLAGFVFTRYSMKTDECASAPQTLDRCAGVPAVLFANELQCVQQRGAENAGQAYGGAPVAAQSPTQCTQIYWGAEKGVGDHESSGMFTIENLKSLAIGLGVVIILAAFAAYLFLSRRPEEGLSDVEVHRALSSDTRVALLRELQRRDLTPTDLSTRVKKSKATVVEHLERLREAGFVEKKEEEGKKFVFYGLTPQGKAILRKAA